MVIWVCILFSLLYWVQIYYIFVLTLKGKMGGERRCKWYLYLTRGWVARETVIKVTTLPVTLRKRPVPLNLHFISATTVKNQLLARRFGGVFYLWLDLRNFMRETLIIGGSLLNVSVAFIHSGGDFIKT